MEASDLSEYPRSRDPRNSEVFSASTEIANIDIRFLKMPIVGFKNGMEEKRRERCRPSQRSRQLSHHTDATDKKEDSADKTVPPVRTHRQPLPSHFTVS